MEEKGCAIIGWIIGLFIVCMLVFVKCENVPINSTVIGKHITTTKYGEPKYYIVVKQNNGNTKQHNVDGGDYYLYDIGDKYTSYNEVSSWRFSKKK